MNDRDKNAYNIKLITTAEGDGAQKTAQQLKDLGRIAADLEKQIQRATSSVTGKSASDSAGAFDEQRKRGNVTQDQAEYLAGLTKEAQATADLTEKTKGLVSIKGNLSKALKKLAVEFPLLGQAISFLKNPYTAAIALIAGFVVALNKQIQKQKEAAEAAAALSAALEPALQQGAQFRTIHAEAAVAANAFARSLAQIGTNAAPAITALDKLLEKTKLLSSLAGEREDAQKANDLARVDEAEAMGLITQQAAIDQRLGIENKYAGQSKSRQLLGIAVDANVNRQKQHRSQDTLREALAEMPGAQTELEAEQARLQQMTQEHGLANTGRDSRLKQIAEEFGISEIDLAKAQGDGNIDRLFAAHSLRTQVGPWQEKQTSLRQEAASIFGAKDASGAALATQQGNVSAAQQRVGSLYDRAEKARGAAFAYGSAADAGVQEHQLRMDAAYGPRSASSLYNVESSRPDALQSFSGPHSSGGLYNIIGSTGGQRSGGTVDVEAGTRAVQAHTAQLEVLTQLYERYVDANKKHTDRQIKILQDAMKGQR